MNYYNSNPTNIVKATYSIIIFCKIFKIVSKCLQKKFKVARSWNVFSNFVVLAGVRPRDLADHVFFFKFTVVFFSTNADIPLYHKQLSSTACKNKNQFFCGPCFFFSKFTILDQLFQKYSPNQQKSHPKQMLFVTFCILSTKKIKGFSVMRDGALFFAVNK